MDVVEVGGEEDQGGVEGCAEEEGGAVKGRGVLVGLLCWGRGGGLQEDEAEDAVAEEAEGEEGFGFGVGGVAEVVGVEEEEEDG